MSKILSFVFLFSVTAFFWKYAISGFSKRKIEFGLRGSGKFTVVSDKAKFFSFLFLAAAFAMTWATLMLLIKEF